jgi:two-component system, cell cycle sensor histidine kinase and response regulator CckA
VPLDVRLTGIRSRLALVAFGAVVPLLLLAAYEVRMSYIAEDKRARTETQAVSHVAAARLEAYVQEASTALRLAGNAVSLDARRVASNDSVLSSLRNQLPPFVSNLSLWDTRGVSLGAAVRDPADSDRRNISGLSEFRNALRFRRLAISGPYLSPTVKAWSVALMLPIVDSGGHVRALVRLATRLERLEQIVVGGGRMVAGLTLVDTSGGMLARSDDAETFVGRERDTSEVFAVSQRSPSGHVMAAGVDGIRRLYSWEVIDGTPWIVRAGIPEDELLSEPRAVLERSISVFAGVLVATGLLIWWLSSGIVLPIKKLSRTALAFGSGQSSKRAELSGPTEVRSLAVSFNQMADTLAEHHLNMESAEERYRLLFDRNPIPMWAYDTRTLRILAVNEAAIAQYGYLREEFLQLTIRDLRDSPENGSFDERMELRNGTRFRQSGIFRHRTKDGRQIMVEITSHPIQMDGTDARLVLGLDVTEQQKMEEQFRQAQKMESIGRLAGGIAHDFNNLLTAILAGAEFAMQDALPGSDQANELKQIEAAGQRAAGLTRQLLAFARRQATNFQPLDLNDVTANVQQMLRRLIGEHISLVFHAQPELWTVEADPGQMEQYLVNLAVNARDAMPNGGQLQLETANIVFDERLASTHGDISPGEYVMLAVSDTGTGMTEEVRRRAFEPFFTTKPVGVGTGLGLATCYGIVKQNRGAIFLYSEPGRGTTIKAYFPRAAGVAPKLEAAPRDTTEAGTEAILLVEDDSLVRDVAERTLRQAGYSVMTAADGMIAYELASNPSVRIDLLITDVVMPRKGGHDLAAELRQLRPGLCVLFTSGYTRNPIESTSPACEAFLPKPYVGSALTRAVRHLLDEQRD